MNTKQSLVTLLCAGATSVALAQTPLTPANFADISNPSTGVYEINGDITLTAGETLAESTYILEGLTFVNNGYTITIEEGVVVRGQPRVGSDVPGMLCVSRGAEIIADGTPTSPIIFTTAETPAGNRWTAGQSFKDSDPFGSPMPADVNRWGALVVLGYAPTNTGTVDTGIAGEAFIEGLTIEDERTTYGGLIPNDSSGVLDHVSIRYSGDAISQDSEIQGLTTGGVGYGTQITNIEVYGSGDDGIEIFGGTATFKNIAISNFDDDGLDIDQGYTGLIQFVFILVNGITNNNIVPDNACEWDGDDCCDGPDENNFNAVSQPTTHPTIYNMTIFGNKGNPQTTISHAIRARRGFGGQINNSIIANFPSQAGLFEINNDSSGVAVTDGFPSQNPFDQLTQGTLGFAGTVWVEVGDGTPAGIGQSAETVAVLENVTYPTSIENITGLLGSAADPGFGAFNPGVGPFDQAAPNGLNPVPNPFAPATAAKIPYTNLFFDKVEYAGAFAPDGFVPLWTTNWTALNVSGVLVDNGNGENL